jgi:hypothetical protein
MRGELWLYDFAIEYMFFDHNDIDTFGIFKSEESESSGSPGLILPHDGAFRDFSELLKICS